MTDTRGEFTRLYCFEEFNVMGLTKTISQINRSLSKNAGTIRGMHFQHYPFEEDKIVVCSSGRIYDVVVDLRPRSKTFLMWIARELTRSTGVVVPAGCAHGFQTLENNSEIIYFVTNQYTEEAEDGVNPFDPLIKIEWPLSCSSISDKDSNRPFLRQDSYFD